ncbi:hypothetical protein NEOLI_005011 [Neolecta irregularis DAH-3]|uniref:Uncharacterized protein n=1 Tax=Neolecta irregularis (strain DAH-3) TaxID=1198029 RepID=A0A1U7LM83_NEOID|nr:hypothetical protein NEOLI_005011 [Neolecta irregularis DAH-3]|eukprot:OLL23738.1 hypothetical protein NEOLI_005011 [Neolecta irregularis DAH-3]
MRGTKVLLEAGVYEPGEHAGENGESDGGRVEQDVILASLFLGEERLGVWRGRGGSASVVQDLADEGSVGDHEVDGEEEDGGDEMAVEGASVRGGCGKNSVPEEAEAVAGEPKGDKGEADAVGARVSAGHGEEYDLRE